MTAPIDHAGGPPPEFSRVFAVERDMGTGKDAQRVEITADAEERAALARRFNLRALDALAAEGEIEVFARGRRARLTAKLTADVVQSCVVTLEPVPAHIEETFTVEFDRAVSEDAGERGEVLVEAEGEDPPDPLPDAGIDVGEAVAEHLGLALDPYPRAPGAGLEDGGWRTGGEEPEGPFAALRKLKKS